MNAATSIDDDLIVSILMQSFSENRSVNYVTKKRKNKNKSIRALMNYAFYECSVQKGAFLSDDSKGVALFTYPNKRKIKNFRYLVEVFKLIMNAFGLLGINKILKREHYIKSFHPKKDFLYLWFIGIIPNQQGKGNGKKLLQEILSLANHLNVPIYLETSTPENLPFYTKNGFKIYHEWFDKEAGFVLYFLRNRF